GRGVGCPAERNPRLRSNVDFGAKQPRPAARPSALPSARVRGFNPVSPENSTAHMTDSLQDRYAPKSRCFGCGPTNQQGLRIKSRVEAEKLVADWTPQKH